MLNAPLRQTPNWIDAPRREEAVALIRDRYRDFGPTLACQMLAERHGHAPACSPERLRTILCLKETRKLSRQLICQYHQQWLHVLPPKDWERRLVGAEVEIRAHLDGTLDIVHHDRELAYEMLIARPQSPVVDAKVVQARPAQAKPPANHPWLKPFSPAAVARVMAERSSPRP